MPEPTLIKFTGKIEEYSGTFRNYALFIPPEVLSTLPSNARFRMEGKLNNTPFNLAIQSAKEAGKYFAISAPLLKTLKVKVNGEVKVVCSIADPDKLDVSEEFEAALDLDPEAAEIYATFTTGIKRSLLHYVNSAKSVETRIKRSLELLEKMKARQLGNQRPK